MVVGFPAMYKVGINQNGTGISADDTENLGRVHHKLSITNKTAELPSVKARSHERFLVWSICFPLEAQEVCLRLKQKKEVQLSHQTSAFLNTPNTSHVQVRAANFIRLSYWQVTSVPQN